MLAVVLALLGGYGWYRLSDTGKRWRYEDKLESYCGGVLPYEETVAFTGLPSDPDTGLPHDFEQGSPTQGYEFCWIKSLDVVVTTARIPDTSAIDLKFYLPRLRADALPTLMGGGWRGFTDGVNTSVVLPCTNRDHTVAVTAQLTSEEPNKSVSRKVAELTTATAANAADHWGCKNRPGTRARVVDPASDSTTPQQANGTCAGLPWSRNKRIDTITETPADRLAPYAMCSLDGEDTDDGYRLEASFGPYALRERGESLHTELTAKPAGGGAEVKEFFWASADCPGDGPRALFQITPQSATSDNPSFARAALAAFAKRAAERRDCTGLQLPSAP
ncbi:hypothetical protein ACFVXC_00195 [Streptomyces sp. NPDC058257]|uniref:hypothetical protein n=1 Tax=Streptomyces sp. NPDC058257 TaxID=3346409 RepID=UPI0036E814A5